MSKSVDVSRWIIQDIRGHPRSHMHVLGNITITGTIELSGDIIWNGQKLSGEQALMAQPQQISSIITNIEEPKSVSPKLLLSIPDADYVSTATDIVNAYYISNTLTNNRLFILPTASDIIAAIPDCKIGSSFQFTVNNAQSGNFSRIVSGNIRVYLSHCPNIFMAQNKIVTFMGIVTNITVGSEAVTIIQCNSV
jgi:hypothetical protein